MVRKGAFWDNLAGPPVRVSPAISIGNRKRHSGWVKLRLCHAKGRSYFLPDVLIGFGGKHFFLPSFFGPNSISFTKRSTGGGIDQHSATFSMDVAAPRGARAARLLVSFSSDGFVRSYDDGAQLYECEYIGELSVPLKPLVAGDCSLMPNGDYALRVYHHTTAASAALISSSGELWSGPYNLAGTEKLENVAHTYFTTLPEIRDEADLRRIGMSSSGKISFQTTSDRRGEVVLDLPVYKSTTVNRAVPLAFEVACELLAPAHLLFHSAVGTNSGYYEVVGSEILRVAVKPNANLKLNGSRVEVATEDLKRFEYVVEGDASSTEGLEAPMREETTKQIAFLERLDKGLDIFQFWLANANTDQFSGRAFASRKLGPKS